MGGGTEDGDMPTSISIGSVFKAKVADGLGGDQIVDFGAKQLLCLLPEAGWTRRLSDRALQRRTRYGVGSSNKTTDPGWAVSADEAPGRTEDILKQKRIKNCFFGQSKKDKKQRTTKNSCEARNYSRAVKCLISWNKHGTAAELRDSYPRGENHGQKKTWVSHGKRSGATHWTTGNQRKFVENHGKA